MSEPFLGEVRPFAFNFAPKGWAMCNGQLLPINQNQALFSLLGTYYGGNGQTTFALPNLQGRSPMHVSNNYSWGFTAGTTSTTLTQQQMPQHQHQLIASTAAADQRNPQDDMFAAPAGHSIYATAQPDVTMNSVVQNTGGSQPFDNHQPYLVINYCIALQGVYPSRD